MVWFGDKPLPEPMLTQFTDAYMRRHWGGDELNHTSCYTAEFLMAENRGAVTPLLPHWNLMPNENKL